MHKSISSKSGKLKELVRNLAEIRQCIDAISEKIIRILAERKKHGFNSSMYAGSGNTVELFDFYKSMLVILCDEDSHARITPEIRALDAKAISLIQKRIALGAEALSLKRKSGMPLRDLAREEELILRAKKIAAECGIDPKISARIMRMIMGETVVAEKLSKV